jgi:hypothetical protein
MLVLCPNIFDRALRDVLAKARKRSMDNAARRMTA